MEACGTSGMKVLANGGLNLSSFDGWWAEAYNEEVGWVLASDEGGDAGDAAELLRLLEEEIVPLFYDRDQAGLPRKWIARMRRSMAALTSRFSATRMVRDYVEQLYHPAAGSLRARISEGGGVGRELNEWERILRRQWHFLHWGEKKSAGTASAGSLPCSFTWESCRPICCAWNYMPIPSARSRRC